MLEVTYFNEIDPRTCEWLQNLFPQGCIDERSIKDVAADDVRHYQRCHFFAGIGGWEYALQLAGWPRWLRTWTGSCPCQPVSGAGRGLGEMDERHLWPEFCRLIAQCRPPVIFGEQVASKLGREWLDGVSLDLEALGYAVGSADLGAASVNAPHIRQRLFWVAYSNSFEPQGFASTGNESVLRTSENGCRMANSNSSRFDTDERSKQWERREPSSGCSGMGDAEQEGPQRQPGNVDNRDQSRRFAANSGGPGFLLCRDNKTRRIPLPESGILPLAYGLPRNMGSIVARVGGMESSAIKAARGNRVARLKGYGNAIVPQVAAVFVRSFMEVMKCWS